MFNFKEEKKDLNKFKWSEKQMIKSVITLFKQNYFSVKNVSWGFFNSGREADLLTISKSHYLTEIEIKISIADLKRDAEKECRESNYYDTRISALYYAMPEDLWRKVEKNPPIPKEAGVIVVTEKNHPKIIKKPKRSCNAKKLDNEQLLRLARLGAMKFWSHY